MHLDEVGRSAEMREREMQKERKEQYKKDLDEQRRVMAGFRRDKAEEDLMMLENKNNYMKELEAKEAQKHQQDRMIAINIMDENLRARNKAIQEVKEAQKKQDQELLSNMKRGFDNEQMRLENERQRKQRLINDLANSYIEQEAMKKERDRQLKELDKIYADQYKEKLLNDEKEHKKVNII